MIEQTLSIIKPNALSKNLIGKIIDHFETSGLMVIAAKMVQLDQKQCAEFYIEHKERPFFNELVEFMSSGPVLLMVLKGDHAVAKNREVMGATDPKKAEPHTIRARFGESVGQNAVHGSDSAESAAREISFFFKPEEICNR